MRVLIVSGIWPPDVGGPASHAPDVARFLRAGGHDVEVVTTAASAPAPEAYPVHWTPRRLPVGARHAHSLVLVARHARSADVVYSTGMFGRSGIGSVLVRRPLVLKLTGDPAFERLRARGAVEGGVDAFQEAEGRSLSSRALRALRNWVVRRADHVFTPSRYLADLAVSWGVPAGRVSVMPNPAPAVLPSAPRADLRRRFGIEGNALAFAGRLTAQKALGVMVAAIAGSTSTDLWVAGAGDEHEALVEEIARHDLGERIHLLGPLPRTDVLELFAAADASLLSSSWENFPHSVVESLAVGTPVIATRAGGVSEVVTDGSNGLLVEVGDAAGLAAAIERFFKDDALGNRLRANAAASVEAYGAEHLLGALEQALQEAAS